MIKIKIASVGKTKEKWLDQALNEYIKRLKPSASVECIWLKDDDQLVNFTGKDCICLDVKGTMMCSEEFSTYLHKRVVEGGSRAAFVIGGPDGLPPVLRNHPLRISLSPLTMTHQLVRLLLLEQIYRAFEILKGSPYHK